MNLRIPVPRPLERTEEQDPPARGGVDAEDLRRVERRAERYVSEQTQAADEALRLKQQQEHAALVRQSEALEARAIVAHADTMKAEANTRLVLFLAVGTIGALVLGPALLGPITSERRPSE